MKKLLILFLFLTSCAVSNPDRWDTITIDKHWPDGYTSWTYKRHAGQNLAWMLFGNDNDGVTPYFHGEPWPFWKWWLRNTAHNYNWYLKGYARWEEGNPYASWDTSHLEYRFWSGDWDSMGFRMIWTKPKKRSWLFWRPYMGIHTTFLSAWFGWGERGQYKAAIKHED